MAKTKQIARWEDLADAELLNIKIRDFNLSIQGSVLEPLVDNLYIELDAKGIGFHPPCYLADEWLCPDKEPIIGIPFFLSHPRLKAIEQKMMFEVEGATDASCMRLLRHEAGHALNYAYELYKKTHWRELFGTFSSKYSNTYYVHPYSKRFVVHLDGNYAQCHPDEDFAETFAVWLAPGSSWETKYKDWPVIKKLKYIDNVMKKISSLPPKIISEGKPPWSASRMTSTLAAFYEKKRKLLGNEFKGFYDDSLMKLFSQKQSASSEYPASKILRRHRRQIADNISRWTGHRKYDVHQLINNLISRCDSLELYAKEDDIIAVVALITAITSNTLRIPKNALRK